MYGLLLIIAGTLAIHSSAGAVQHDHAKMAPASYPIPESLKAEHHELHAELAALATHNAQDGGLGPEHVHPDTLQEEAAEDH